MLRILVLIILGNYCLCIPSNFCYGKSLAKALHLVRMWVYL